MKQFLSDQTTSWFGSTKNLLNILSLLILAIALPVGINLAKNRQIFYSQADRGVPIEVTDGACVTTKDGQKSLICEIVPLKLISPLGPPVPATISATPTPSASASATPSATPSPSASASASATPPACNPKKFDTNTWSKRAQECKNGKQRVIYSCQDKTKTKKQKCDGSTGILEQSPFNGPHNIPGKIEAEDFDNGGEDVAYHDTKTRGKQSKPYRAGEHVDISRTNDPLDKKGYEVRNSEVGEWIEYTAEVLQNGNYVIESRLQNNKGGVFHIEIDGVNKSGSITIPAGNPGKEWSIVKSPPIELTQGQIIIRVVMDEGNEGKHVGTFNYFEFKIAPAANLLQKIQNALTNKVFADDDDKTDDASKSAKKKCSNRLKRKGLCSSAQPSPSPKPDCNDDKDNDGDGKTDKDDPDCHTDGNAENKKSYDKKRSEKPKFQCADGKDNDSDGKIDAADPQCHSDQNASNNASYNPNLDNEASSSILPPGASGFTGGYRIADSESGLSSKEFTPYLNEPVITNFTLSDNTPGEKQIWVEFKDSKDSNITKKEHIIKPLIAEDPEITGLDCSLDITRQNIKVTLKGKHLGQKNGKITSENTRLDILDWKDDKVTALLKNPSLPTDSNQNFNFTLTREDGEEPDDTICRIDSSLISLGAKVFCREEGKFEVNNVKVSLKDENNNKVDETVAISKDGIISVLKTKLQSGKQYIISIKAPFSLRRNAIFTASEGTTIVAQDDGSFFILPIGDIAPVTSGDEIINSADRAVLTQQWIASKNATKNLTGDFNKDSRVNSFDWACMRYDFNKSSDPVIDNVTVPK